MLRNTLRDYVQKTVCFQLLSETETQINASLNASLVIKGDPRPTGEWKLQQSWVLMMRRTAAKPNCRLAHYRSNKTLLRLTKNARKSIWWHWCWAHAQYSFELKPPHKVFFRIHINFRTTSQMILILTLLFVSNIKIILLKQSDSNQIQINFKTLRIHSKRDSFSNTFKTFSNVFKKLFYSSQTNRILRVIIMINLSLKNYDNNKFVFNNKLW